MTSISGNFCFDLSRIKKNEQEIEKKTGMAANGASGAA